MEIGFQGTQVRDDGTGPVLVSHRQRLVVVAGPDRGLEREVEGTRISLGTSPNNDIQLSDRTVSRIHCEIVVRDERYYLRDLDSTNGSEVNGTKVVEAVLAPPALASALATANSCSSRRRSGNASVLTQPTTLERWWATPPRCARYSRCSAKYRAPI